MEKPAEHLTAGDMTLRRMRPEFADELHALIEDARDRLSPWLPWAAGQQLDGTRDYLEKSVTMWDDDVHYNYVIFWRGEMAGGCGLMTRQGPGRLEIGYWLGNAAEGHGVASTASRLLTEASFAIDGIEHVEIRHDALNERSGAVPARLGFTETSREPDEDRERITVIWELTRERFAELHRTSPNGQLS
ncbi:GNAT family N-acetyltransferase [Longispora albida]|uniref:GNAT family N-acetyltransferase n=1 Tax=Longispora albida TaxID=203523 RepID=UPI000380F3E4|nr:GNAT family N-acetyltransferase [Longispora albida]